MALLPVVLAVLLLQVTSATGQEDPQPPQQNQAGQQRPQGQPAQSAPPSAPPQTNSSTTADDLFSIDHIRKELERPPGLTFVPNPNVPSYRVEIQGKRFQLPDLRQQMAKAVPRMPVQVPYGGTTSADMARLNTPPEFYGSAPFSNADLLKMSALSGAYGLAGALVKKAIEARASVAEAQIREQIQRELAEIAAHNAEVAAKEKKKKDGGDRQW